MLSKPYRKRIFMDKLIYVLTAGAAALVLTTGVAVAADTRPVQEPAPRALEKPPGGPPSVMTGTEKEKLSEEYTAALKKCDNLKASEKQKCLDATNKKFGFM